MTTVTLYLTVHTSEPENIIPWLVPIDDRMLELGYIQVAEQDVELDSISDLELKAAIKRGMAQCDALAKMNNYVPLRIRDQEQAA
jgi:hypothetical protein